MMQRFTKIRCAFSACAILATCCEVTRNLLKSAFHSYCIQGNVGPNGGSNMRSLTTAFLVCSCIAFVAIVAFHVLKSRMRSVQGWALVAAICSKWQPAYLFIVSAQRLVLRALLVVVQISARNDLIETCSLILEYAAGAHFMWECVILVMSFSTVCCDLDLDFSPALRRCAYFFLAVCLTVDALGSIIWGNTGTPVSIRVGNLPLALDNLLTDCIASQALIAFHFLFVSYRSRNGRAWAYASLRFELDKPTESLKRMGECMQADTQQLPKAASVPMLSPDRAPNELPDQDLKNSSACIPTRQRWLQLQQQRLSKCRVFVIPIAAGTGACSKFRIERPLLKLRCLQLLHRLADAHPNCYLNCTFCFVAVPSFASLFFLSSSQDRGIATLIFNSAMFTAVLGFMSSPSYNLDRIAVKLVTSSFRFANCATLLVMFLALEIRRAYTGVRSFWQTAAIAVLSLFFCLCALIDSAPHFPAMAQLCISVT